MKILLLLSGLIAVNSLGHAATILISPPSLTIAKGVNFEMDILASGIAIGAFDFDFTFEPKVLSLADVAFDAHLGAPLSIQGWMPGSGAVTLSEISFLSPTDLAPLQAGSYRIAHLTFTTIDPGLTNVVISRSVVSDPNGTIVFPEMVGATVTVAGATPIPEPDSRFLLLGGWLLLLAVRNSLRSASRAS